MNEKIQLRLIGSYIEIWFEKKMVQSYFWMSYKLSKSQSQKFAKKRLLHDLKEIVRNPLPTVSAIPLEQNLFEWYHFVNIWFL